MIAAVLILVAASAAAQQSTPNPQPFPKPAAGAPAAPGQLSRPVLQSPPPDPAPGTPAPDGAPTETLLGVPLYPGAQFIASYDAGRGQRYYLFGTTAGFNDLVTYYRNVLKQRGELLFDIPATHSFEVGKYREDTMAFPPGVTIKDFQTDLSQGYPNPKRGAQPARFPTIIQIVPVTER